MNWANCSAFLRSVRVHNVLIGQSDLTWPDLTSSSSSSSPGRLHSGPGFRAPVAAYRVVFAAAASQWAKDNHIWDRQSSSVRAPHITWKATPHIGHRWLAACVTCFLWRHFARRTWKTFLRASTDCCEIADLARAVSRLFSVEIIYFV